MSLNICRFYAYSRFDVNYYQRIGPKSATVLQRLVDSELDSFPFMGYSTMKVADIDGCFIARGGYTGEDGFEVNISFQFIPKFINNVYDLCAIGRYSVSKKYTSF